MGQNGAKFSLPHSLAQGLEELDIVIGLQPGQLHLLEQALEGEVVRRACQLKHLDHLQCTSQKR